MVEIWKPIEGFEDIYEVSDQGRVRNIQTGLIRKNVLNHNGYPALYLKREGKQYHRFVHRLVAAAFLGPLPAGDQVNHKDGDKTNNHVGNLEYISPSQNISHAWRELGFKPKRYSGEANANSKLSNEQIAAIKADWATGKFTYTSLGEKYEVNRTTIARIVQGKARNNG